MAGSCRAPRSVGVSSYLRAAPRRARKLLTYWTCSHGGRTCGIRHSSELVSLRHARRLNAKERKQGRRAGWHPIKKGT